jgi:hypothetical protein
MTTKEDKINRLIAEIRELDELKDLIIEMKQERHNEIERISNGK